MNPGMSLTPAEPDVLSMLILFIAIVLFGLFMVGALWVLARVSEQLGWSKRRRRNTRIPQGARTRAPSKAVSFARQTERLDQLEVAPIPLTMLGAAQVHDALQAWAMSRGAPDLRVLAQVDLNALFEVTSSGDAGRAGAEVLRGHKVDYVLAEPGGMPVAGLMQTDPEDIRTQTLLRETTLRELFHKGALPLVDLAPDATEAEIHASLDAAFDLIPEAEPALQGATDMPAFHGPQAVPDPARPPRDTAPVARPALASPPRAAPPLTRPGRRRRGER